jgi:hypothetical protein
MEQEMAEDDPSSLAIVSGDDRPAEYRPPETAQQPYPILFSTFVTHSGSHYSLFTPLKVILTEADSGNKEVREAKHLDLFPGIPVT